MEESFPIQQKILITTILLIIKNDKNKEITIGRFHDIYKKICKNLNVHPTDQSEFLNLWKPEGLFACNGKRA
jgi:cell division control protein 6